MVIGGVASSVLGQARLTIDIDATMMIDDKDLDHFLAHATTVGLTLVSNTPPSLCADQPCY